MSRRKPYLGPSESQSAANAEALQRRGLPYSAASQVSFDVQWNWHRREPRDLREAVHMARKAYADEVPTKLHDGPDAIGDDGTPRMSARAEGYIFGDPGQGDARSTPEDPIMVSHYLAPFRAALDAMSRGDQQTRRQGRIVSHVTIGSQGPVDAALREEAHPLDAKLVAEDALRTFLRRLTDLKLTLPREIVAA